MKIKSMTATFGRLEKARLEPGPGLTLIHAPNEGGKSTWAAFWRAMLYGIDTGARDKKGCLADKNRYQPWSGAPMEGEITLELEGREITIRRGPRGNTPFGSFSAVYTGTQEPVPGLTASNCGELLTGVGPEVFARSAFLGDGNLALTAAPELERRIAALVTSGEEEVSFSQAMGRLKEWKNRRRVNKSVGEIPKLEAELAQVRQSMNEMEETATKHRNEDFFKELDKYLDIARDSLEIKRQWLQTEIIDTHMIPAYMEYVGTINNHFSTIGVCGMNEMCENFMGKNILDPDAKQFCVEVGDHIRNRLLAYQEETGHLYNYEATPAESTCYRFALADRKLYPDIITQGSGLDCYYTNSCHIPVKLIEGIDSTFKHQEELQTQFTGGTVIHIWENGAISGEQAKAIVKAMCENYKVPYMSLSPISRYCDDHGYIAERVDKCPYCQKRLRKYQRITGYLRDVDNFNRGKKAEFSDRVQL